MVGFLGAVVEWHLGLVRQSSSFVLTFSTFPPCRPVQFDGQLDDRAQHQAKPLHGTWVAERHTIYLSCQGNKPGWQPEQRTRQA